MDGGIFDFGDGEWWMAPKLRSLFAKQDGGRANIKECEQEDMHHDMSLLLLFTPP